MSQPVEVRRFAKNIVRKDVPGERPLINLDGVASGTGQIAENYSATSTLAEHNLAANPGEVLFGKLRPYLAKSLFVAMPLFVSGEFLVLEPLSSVAPRWLLYLTLSDPFLEHSISGAYGSKMPRTSWDQVASFAAPLPTVDEQRRIADFLDGQVTRIDRAVALRRGQFTDLCGAMSSIARERVLAIERSDRTTCPLTWAESLPSNWSVARLASVAHIGTGHTPSRTNPEYWLDCDIPWLTTGDVRHFRDDSIESLRDTAIQISAIGLANSAAVLHPKGTVALSRTASPGFSIVLEMDSATSQDFVVWRPSPLLHPYYLLWVLRAMRSDLLGRLATGSTHQTIYFPDLTSIQVPLPPIQEQTRIADAIRKQTAMVITARAATTASIRLLQERKRALISACVTGEFDVSTASDRASEAVIR